MSDNQLSRNEINTLETIMRRKGAATALLLRISEIAAYHARRELDAKNRAAALHWDGLAGAMRRIADHWVA